MQSDRRTRSLFATSLALALVSAGPAGFATPAGALKNRAVYNAGNLTALPGTLVRSEGGPPTGDADADAAYDHAGDVYDAFWSFWGRDSYDGRGASIRATVHYASSYCNAFWNGTQFAFGDGNPAAGCGRFARSRDAFAHEYTKAVTESESGLSDRGESGGISSGLADVFAAFVDAWVAGGRSGALVPTPATWTIAEDVFTPPLRYVNDPAADGFSLDYWTSGAGNTDVSYSSGILRLAFYLLAQGGTHPRGKSTVVVTGIGMEKAIRLFYLANANFLTGSSSFASARSACIMAATSLGLTVDEQNAVKDAWAAVGVGAPVPDVDVVLVNGVPVTGLSSPVDGLRFFKLEVPAGATNLRFVLSGGTGDADLYVRRGSRPTESTYDCRSWSSTNSERCPFAAPVAGTYFAMIDAYRAYSGVTLTGSYDRALPPGDPYLTAGVPVPNLSGASGSNKYWRIARTAGRTLRVRISGGSGDADLYVYFGSRPTTSTYLCRPYTAGNTEACSFSNTVAGDYYILLRGFTSYSGVTLVATD
jgi:vibriolysin